MKKTYRVTLTEKVNRDWTVEIDAESEDAARNYALDHYESGTQGPDRVYDVEIDWSEEV